MPIYHTSSIFLLLMIISTKLKSTVPIHMFDFVLLQQLDRKYHITGNQHHKKYYVSAVDPYQSAIKQQNSKICFKLWHKFCGKFWQISISELRITFASACHFFVQINKVQNHFGHFIGAFIQLYIITIKAIWHQSLQQYFSCHSIPCENHVRIS